MRKKPDFNLLATILFYFCNGFIPMAYGQSLVFGPEFFANNSGTIQRTVGSFSIEDERQKFFLSIQGGESSEQKPSRGIVKINGAQVAALNIGKHFKMLTKPIRLQKKNDISIESTNGVGASVLVAIMKTEDHISAALVPPVGKLLNLAGYASIVFPAGTFESTQRVMIYTTASASTNALFEAHATGPRLPYEIRINTGNKAPEKDVEVDLNIPDSFFSSPYQIHIFARMHDNPEVPEEHDRFFMISSSVDEVTDTVRTTLPRHAFSTRFGTKEAYEAVMIVGLLH